MFHKRSLQWTGNPWSNLESSKKSTVQAPQNHDIIRAAIKKKQCIDVGKMEETMVFTSNMSVFSRTCTATTAADRPLCISKGHFWDTPCSNDQKWLKCVESKYQFSWKVHPGDVSKPLSDEQNAAVRFHSMANGRPVWHGRGF